MKLYTLFPFLFFLMYAYSIMRIAGAYCAEQFGIIGVKRPFDPNIIMIKGVRRMSIIKSIRKFERIFDIKAEKFMWRHPFIGFFSIFIGMPIFILVCVCISTIAIVFPMAWIFGWM